MHQRPKILLCNDDGIQAPGLKSLWKALFEADIADIFIIAPATEKSGAGASITWDKPLEVCKFNWPENTPAWSISGSPADCIKIGTRMVLDFQPDFILSGINAGSNAGRNVLHSGTVGAVIEGIFRGIPGIAFSCENGSNPNFHVAEKCIIPIFEYVRKYPLPRGSFLNVNVPHAAKDTVKGFRLTRQGKGRWSEDPFLHLETELSRSYWLGGKPDELVEPEDCDIALLREGYLTAVPIFVNDLTEYSELEKRKKDFDSLFAPSIVRTHSTKQPQFSMCSEKKEF